MEKHSKELATNFEFSLSLQKNLIWRKGKAISKDEFEKT